MATAFDIEHLDIDEDRSSLESLRGKRIGRLVVHIRRPDDAEHVASCKSVGRLELWGWTEPDLTSIKDLAVRYLRMVRGRQMSVKDLNTKRLKKLWVHSCGKLRELDIPRLPWLWVWACNNLDQVLSVPSVAWSVSILTCEGKSVHWRSLPGAAP